MSRGKAKPVEPTEPTKATKAKEPKYKVIQVLPNYAYIVGDVITIISPEKAKYFIEKGYLEKCD
jgi:hypothetical protein